MKRVKLLSVIALLSVTVQQTWAQVPEVLSQWNFAGVTGFGTSPFTPAVAANNITIGGLTRGPGITTASSGNAAASAWGGNGFNEGGSSATLTTAVTNGNYVTFTVTPQAGYNVSFTEIAPFNIRRSGTGPQEMQWQYSTNGTTFTNLGMFSMVSPTTTSDGNEQDAIPLGAEAALQNVPSGTTVTFRAAMWNASQAGGNWYFNGATAATSKSLIIMGVVAPGDPLPLQLLSFKGKAEQKANHLDWSTAQESNVSRFDLERSNDGQHFATVTTLHAKGNERSGNQQYSYTDNEAGSIAYYRLKMIDNDGKFSYSQIVVLRTGLTSSNIRLYPNPTGNTLFLEGLQGKASYFITDAMGRTVVAATTVTANSNTAFVDVAHLVSGIYFLRFIDEAGSASLKFMKK